MHVFLNGQPQKETTHGGQLRISDLEPQDYVVKVSKNGFQDLPEQKVRIRKGEERKLAFNLQPLPRFGTLSIQGGPPGAQVLIDQFPLGPCNRMEVSLLPISLRAITSWNCAKTVSSPSVCRSDSQWERLYRSRRRRSALEATTGTVKITFTPADAVVSLTKTGESPVKVTSGSALNLPPGSYTMSARMADNITRTSTLEIVAGQTKAFDLPLAPGGMSLWDDPSGWKQENGSFLHKGGDFVLYSASPTSGTFFFRPCCAKVTGCNGW